ncbi:MAG: hypothetical protein MHM6MM_009176 [Cercozoa sp. M6MM]
MSLCPGITREQFDQMWQEFLLMDEPTPDKADYDNFDRLSREYSTVDSTKRTRTGRDTSQELSDDHMACVLPPQGAL